MQREQTQAEAEAILDRIKSYWAKQGYEVDGAVYPAGYNERLRSTVYEVCTDLVNGMPKGMFAKAA
ncbi:MAG: phosphoglycolate phosphatase [Pseudomonadota bacterium]